MTKAERNRTAGVARKRTADVARKRAADVARERTVVIGLASADWLSLHPHIDAGRMPNLQLLIEGGTVSTLASAAPLTREALYTSIATGLLADRHGVVSELQVRADRGGVERTGRRSWQASAFWELLEGEGIRTASVNWPATSPADRWPGLHVDDSFATPSGTGFETWAMQPHCVSPAELARELAELRVHPNDDLADYIIDLVPRAREVEQAKDRRLASLGAILARAATVHAAATHIAARPDWDVLCVYYRLTHEIRTDFVNEPPDGLFGDVVARTHTFQDMFLGRLIELAGENATVIVLSANGISFDASGALRGHPRGVLVARGAGIAADAILPGIQGVDIAPTLLARYGLAPPCTDGRVLEALVQRVGVGHAGVGQTVPGTANRASGDDLALRRLPARPFAAEPGHVEPHHPAETGHAEPGHWDPADALLAEGYRDTLSDDQIQAMVGAECLRLFHLSNALISTGDVAAAAMALEALLEQRPRDPKALLRLARCRVLMGDNEGCRPLGEALLEIDPYSPWGHLVMARWAALTSGAELAEPYLVSARELGAEDARALTHLGGLELLLGRPRTAVTDFEAATAFYPDMAEGHFGLGLARAAMGDDGGAETALRRAIEVEYNYPLAHMQLGAILAARRGFGDAVRELAIALAQQPGLAEAQTLLDRAREDLAQELAAAAMARRQ